MSWTFCSCGHIAQDHNVARSSDPGLPKIERGPVSGNEKGHWSIADIEAVEHYGCDVTGCPCRSYDGKKVE